MRYALNEGKLIEAESSGQQAKCPGCGQKVFSRCPPGAVNHWVHVSKKDCVGCYTEMTAWHAEWQNEFPPEAREKWSDDRTRRADVKVPSNGFVIEFQHSSMTGPEMLDRERVHGDLVWVVDATEWSPKVERVDSYATVWNWQAETGQLDRWRVNCVKPVFFDFGRSTGVLHVHTFERYKSNSEPRGTGELMSREEFIARAQSDWIKTAAPIVKIKPQAKQTRERRSGKREWKDGEIGAICEKTRKSQFFAATVQVNVEPEPTFELQARTPEARPDRHVNETDFRKWLALHMADLGILRR